MTEKIDVSERRTKLSPAKRALLEKRLQGAWVPDSESQVIPRRPERDIVPLSFAQERLWFLDQLEPGNPAYNRPLALRLTGPLDVTTLEKTLSEVLRRHEALRVTFSAVEGRPVQVISPVQSLDLPVVELGQLPPAERESRIRRVATEEAQRPFDLTKGPLLRATLLRLAREEHVLLLVMHHIIFDGWSAGVLIKEIAALYEAFSTRQPSPLPELPIQYADFAHWQRQWLQGEVLEAQLSYWQETLAGAPPSLELPTDRPRPATQTYQGAHQSLLLPPSLLQSLKTLSQQEGVTLYMTLLAAFKVLLQRYTGQDDIVVGSPVAGRTHVETERLIGFFVNTLVLRTDLAGNPTFRELLGRVREVALGAYAHQDLPFEKLVEALRPERDVSRPPLFQVMFNLENVPQKTVEIQGLNIDEFDFDSGIAQFDLSLEIVEEAERLRTSLEYNADLFEAATIERMLGHFQILLDGIVTGPDQAISTLPLLTKAERHQLLVEWNDTQTNYPRDQCAHQLFEDQVERTPDANAVVFEDQQLTYRELNAHANQLAHHLRKLGVGPEVMVGICLERSLEMVIGLLGILKAGGAYLPLDPRYPPERLAFMLEDAQVPVLLTEERLLEDLPHHEARPVCLDTDWERVARESPENLVSQTTSGQLAYVIYTSGSTGRPKGVAVEHQAVNRLVCNTDYVQLQPTDRVAQVSNASFDAATFEIWGALLHGAQLVVIPTEVVLSPKAFAAQLQGQGISVLFLTTALFNQLAGQVPSAFRSVQHLLFGGEAVDPRWVKEVLENGLPERLLHVYGPTESTTFTSWYLVQVVPAGATTIPIGRPIANTQICLLDKNLQPVPVGIPGELYIGGDGLARSYLNRPELTAERFIPNPFSDKPGARLYRTGDLARYLPDGNIEFLGRMDHQAKIRGFRIEPGEIEAMLGQHPSVRETVVLTRDEEREPGYKRLVGYIVPAQIPPPTVSELQGFLKEKLPGYMVPSTFVMLEKLPLTPSGKIDRRALPAPDTTRPELEEAFVAPRIPLEETLASIWADLLGLEQIGIHDNFFELGGHSLLVTQLISRLRNVFQMELPLRTLFEKPTIAGLAARIETFRIVTQEMQAISGAPVDDWDEGRI